MDSIKNIKGLKIPEKFIIKSLEDYITYLYKFKDNKYYFRGESQYYREIMASGLREDDIDYRKELMFQYRIRKYYNEVGQRLSSIDRRAFTAFSQHHGIPTNLIDISISPLISLYFACQGRDEDTGYVYLIEQNNTIDITERISNSKEIHINIIDLLCSSEENDVKKNFEMFKELFIGNRNLLIYLFNLLIDEYKTYLSLEKIDVEFLKIALDGFEEKNISLFFKHDEDNNEKKIMKSKVLKIQREYYSQLLDFILYLTDELNIRGDLKVESYEETLIYIYYLMTKKLISSLKEFGEYVAWFNFLPIFTYNPITEFQRIKNQQGLFIHQAYQIAHEAVYDCSVFTRQRIWPDKVFIIENKKKILKQLDILGFNEKYIFYDFDSIANYINKSF